MIEPLPYDSDTTSQVISLTDKLNELIAAYNNHYHDCHTSPVGTSTPKPMPNLTPEEPSKK